MKSTVEISDALRDASVRGDGLVDGVELGDWSQVRALIYDDTAS